jgi:hypothetical protein
VGGNAKDGVSRVGGKAVPFWRRQRIARPGIGVAAVAAAVIALGAVWIWMAPPAGAPGQGSRTSGPVVELSIPPGPGSDQADPRVPGGPPASPGATDGNGPPAFAAIPDARLEAPLTLGADPALLDLRPFGPIPKIADDGRAAWQVYARPFTESDALPLVAMIITGLGLDPEATTAAVRKMPGGVTLAFDPYAANLNDWVEKARRGGHEVLLSLPLASEEFPFQDPGPDALLATLKDHENLARLEIVMARMTQYVGMISVYGSGFKQHPERLRAVLKAIQARGLIFVAADAASTVASISAEIGPRRAAVDLIIDQALAAAAIDQELNRLEALARERKSAVGLARPYPLSLQRLSRWIGSLGQRGIVIGPVSAIARRKDKP